MNRKTITVLCCILALLVAVGSTFGIASCVRNLTNESEEIKPPKKEAKHEMSGYKLVKSGVSEYKILLSNEPEENEIVAAEELQLIMKEATGAELPIVYEDGKQKDMPVISIGQTELASSKGIDISDYELNRSGYYIKTVENQLFIVGGEDGGAMGCIYGVYDLLEECVDYRYFHFDEIYYKSKGTVYLYKYDEVVKPSFDYRSTSYTAMSNQEYMKGLRLFAYDGEYGMKGYTQTDLIVNKKSHSDHLFGATKVVGEKTVVDHWFSSEGEQLCWTAGEEMELQAAKDIYANIQSNPDKIYFQLGQANNSDYCRCERCEQAKKDWAMNDAGLQINFANHVAEIIDGWIKRDYPKGREVRIVILAYMGTEEPPVIKDGNGAWRFYSDKVKPHASLYVEFSPINADFTKGLDEKNNPTTYSNLKKWNEILGNSGRLMLWTYETNFSYFMYNLNNFAAFKSHMQAFDESGIDYVFSQGATVTNQPAFQELRLYVQSRIMWDVTADYNEQVKEFMSAFYKEAAPEITEYYNLIKLRYEQMEALYGYDFSSINADISSKEIWTEGIVKKISDIFDRAYAKIDKYKYSSQSFHTKMYERIKVLELTNIYTVLTYYHQSYEQSEINSLVEDFNYYTAKFGITHYKNGEYYTGGMSDHLKKEEGALI